MFELSDADAELVYDWLPREIQADLEYDAIDTALEATDDEIVERLEAAADDPDCPFDWGDIYFERRDRDRDQWDLVPITGTEGDSDIRDDAKEYGWNFVDAVREQVRERQEATNFSPREFVAFVLAESNLTWAEAAREMDVAEGTFASKMQRDVRPEIESARETVAFVERFEA